MVGYTLSEVIWRSLFPSYIIVCIPFKKIPDKTKAANSCWSSSMEEYFQNFYQAITAWKNIWKHSFMGNDYQLYSVLRYSRKRDK